MKKTPLLLGSLILIPLLLLGWLSVRLEQHQQQLFSHQLESLIEVQLDEIDQRFQQHFQRLEQALDQQAEQLLPRLYSIAGTNGSASANNSADSDQAIRTLLRNSPYIDQLFILNADGERLFPSAQTTTRQEQQFLSQIQPLLDTPALFQHREESDAIAEPSPLALSTPTTTTTTAPTTQAYSAQLKSAPAAPEIQIAAKRVAPSPVAQLEAEADSLVASSSPAFTTDIGAGLAADSVTGVVTGLAPASPPERRSSWIAWYNQTRLQHIYWVAGDQGEILGFSLNSARLLSDLINLLPTSESPAVDDPQAEALENVLFTLLDNSGAVSYQWGGLDDVDAERPPLKTLPLSHPLGSWKLEYRSSALLNPDQHWLEKGALLLLTLCGLMLLGWLLYRELNRETRLAQQRVNFVSQVSHELKTPLTNIRLYAEMLDADMEEAEPRERRYLAIINNESRRLSRLIDNVLDFSRLGRQQMQLQPEPLSVVSCLAETLELFAPSLQQHGLHSRLLGPAYPIVEIDRHCLEQIIGNLLSNCEKYAPDSGELTLEYSYADGYSSLLVKDQGPGIPAAEQARIFDQFYRISNRLTDGVAGTGTGIGLSIARALARLHGGDLILLPGDESTGACFKLTLKTPAVTDSPSQV